jgi:hypothetical protein
MIWVQIGKTGTVFELSLILLTYYNKFIPCLRNLFSISAQTTQPVKLKYQNFNAKLNQRP